MDSFAAGAIAGVSEVLTMYPLDVVKTRSQLLVGKSIGTFASLSNIVKQEGVSRLYRGIIPPIFMEAPKRAIKFTANDMWGQFYRKLFGVEKTTQTLSILTGASAGATESFVVVPFDLVKIRLQDKKSAHLYLGMSLFQNLNWVLDEWAQKI
jgi:solute carrier family 25 2-oxodicarboxylate transporter 21